MSTTVSNNISNISNISNTPVPVPAPVSVPARKEYRRVPAGRAESVPRRGERR